MSHGSPIPLGVFETPDVRLARLRTQFQSTSQSMGDTVTDLVDLEARRRTMEDNLRRFRQVEQRQNLQFPSRLGAQVTPTPQPRPSITDARVTPAPLTEGAQTPEVGARRELLAQGLNDRQVDLVIRSAQAGERVPEALFEAFGGGPGRFERVAGRTTEIVGGAISAADNALFVANQFINRQLDTPPEQQPLREDIGLFRERLTEEQRANLRSVPLVGPALEREVGFLSQPAGLAASLAFPGAVAAGAGGGIAAATAAQELGAGEDVQLAAQIAGNILVPGGGLVPAGAVTRPVAAGARAGRQLVGEAAERARLAPELGGPLRGGEGVRLTNGLLDTRTVERRLAEIDAQLAQPKIKGGRSSLLKERAELQAQRDINEITTSGRPVQEQLDEINLELGSLQTELQTRTVPFRGRFRSREFIRPDKESRLGAPSAEELARKPSAAAKRAEVLRRSEQRFPDISSPELNAREKVFREFSENAKFEPVEGAPPLRGGEETAERLAGVDPPRFDVEPAAHIAKADPSGMPPRKPPPAAGGATPDDPQFDELRRVALTGEAPEETLIRRHSAAIATAERDLAIEVRANNETLVNIGIGRRFRQSVVAAEEGSFDELNSLLHNPGAVARGERVVPDNLQGIYDQLRTQTDFEQAARIDFSPDMALAEDYFFRGWQPPEGLFTGTGQRGVLGRNPAFRLPRVDATYDEMIEAGFKPLFANPAEQARYSQRMGVRFREQMKLIDDIRTKELALNDAGGPLPEGWRVPEVGPAFEGKPYVGANGEVSFTRRVAVPESLATRLENAYGKTPRLGKGKIFGKTIDFQKTIDALVFLPKRAKLVGSVFQHVDFLSRSHFGAWTGFIDALRRGQPVNAVKHLVVWPKAATEIVQSAFSPGARSKLAKLAVDDTPLWPKTGRKISNRMISEAGLSTRDETLLPELDAVIREVLAEPAIVRMGKLPLRLLGDLERAWRKGLFEGFYVAAPLTDIKNNIGPMILRQHPRATDEQLAGMIAKAANTSYSTTPAATSVVQNQQARWFLTRFLFSMGENEGLLRAFTGAIRGENAAFFRTRLLGTYLGLMTLASTIHFASTGKPLPFDRFSPISKDKFGPLPFGYNTKFASPNIPLTGRNATEITLDVVGQMDTAFRLLDPKSFLSARMSVPARAAFNQAAGKDFFGAPINEVGPDGVLSRASNLAQDLFLPIGVGQAGAQLLRENIEAAEGLINPGETRLGTAGIAVQATGVNLRAEQTRALVDRTRNEVIQELGLEGAFEDLDPAPRSQVTAEVENRIGDELELRRETSRLRGQASTLSQQIEATAAAGVRVETEDLVPAAKGILDGDSAALEAYNKARTIFFASRRAVQESEAARLGLSPREREARTQQQGFVNAYYALEPEPGPNGFVDREDMDKFFAAQDKIFAKMNSETQEFVRSVSKVFTDPDVIAVEEMRLDAIAALKEITALPKWNGLTAEEGDKVDDLVTRITADVQRFKAQAVREGDSADSVTFRNTAEWLRDRGDITALDAENAIAISSGRAIREQGRIDLALENRRVLLTIFPNFFDSVIPVDVEREELTEQEIGQLEPAGVR